MDILLVYLFLINAAGFFLMLADKRRAKENLWRIPERVLLTVALLGGSGGVYSGMKFARHKTRKPVFSIGVPVIFVLEVILFLFLGEILQ